MTTYTWREEIDEVRKECRNRKVTEKGTEEDSKKIEGLGNRER